MGCGIPKRAGEPGSRGGVIREFLRRGTGSKATPAGVGPEPAAGAAVRAGGGEFSG